MKNETLLSIFNELKPNINYYESNIDYDNRIYSYRYNDLIQDADKLAFKFNQPKRKSLWKN